MTAAVAISFPKDITDAEMRVTPAACAKMAELIASSDGEASAIRVFVSGGGCGGMTYGMTYADQVTDYDRVIEGNGFRILVDAVALSYLQGCEIDFNENSMRPSFVFNNVFQKVGGSGTCGACGGSGGGGGCGSGGY